MTTTQYVQAHTEEFEELASNVTRLSAGDDGADLRHPDAETLRRWRALYAPRRAPRSSSGAWASSQHIHGTDNARCLIALALMTGQSAGRAPGCTRCAARTTCRAPRTSGLIPMVYPDYQSVDEAATSREVRRSYGACRSIPSAA